MEVPSNSPVTTGEQTEGPRFVESSLAPAEYEPKSSVDGSKPIQTSQPVGTSGLQGSKTDWVAEPFQPVLDILERLDHADPKLAAQAARLVGLYRRLWESCVSKHLDSQRLQEANHQLRTSNVRLCQERETLKHGYEDQEALLDYFQQGLEKARNGIVDVLRIWGNASSDFSADHAFTTAE
ncbi:uncharacterized protein PFLUO_LOCUS5866 [Penicillium psychrofluorescens]|uniref:uncharacterized protein n=1 Tax=Penicillium psychrofluorescens TaxID=3158075 RepID=UPI003CCDF408